MFNDVDRYETKYFAANEGCIWGANCLPALIPDGEVGAVISAFEHDGGDISQIRATFTAALNAASGILAATGVASWVGAVVTGVGAVIMVFLGFLEDDHIADQTFVFTRQAVYDQLGKFPGSFDITRLFTDHDGEYTLRIRITQVV